MHALDGVHVGIGQLESIDRTFRILHQIVAPIDVINLGMSEMGCGLDIFGELRAQT